MEIIDRMHAKGLCVYPPEADRDPSVRATEALWRKWSRWGVFDFHTHTKPHPIVFAAAFDPERLQARVARHGARGRCHPAPA